MIESKDIVYRLKIADGDSSDTQYHLDAEAADEIEQLRDALAQIAAEIREILPLDRHGVIAGSPKDRLLKLADQIAQPLTPEEIAAEIRVLASTYWGQGRQDFLDLADRIYPIAKGTNA